MRIWLWFLFAILLGACGSSQGPTSLNGLPGPTQGGSFSQGSPPGLVVITPSSGKFFTTSSNPVTVTGRTSADASEADWSSNGQQGTLSVGGWSAAIPLREGDNQVTFRARGPGGEVVIKRTITLNSRLAFTSRLTASESGLFVNESRNINFDLSTENSNQLDKAQVSLLIVDPQGNPIQELGKLTDNNDFHFQGQFSVQANSAAGQMFFRVKALVGGQPVLSELLALDVVTGLSEQQITQFEDISLRAQDIYNAALARKQSHPEGQAACLEFLSGQAEVERAGATGPYGVWIQFKSGLLGGVLATPPGLKAGAIRSTRPVQTFPKRRTGRRVATGLKTILPRQEHGLLVPDEKKGLCLAPYARNFPGAEHERVAGRLQTAEPIPYPCTTKINESVVLSDYRTFADYGVIHISAHGNTYGDALMAQMNGWEFAGRQAYVLGGYVNPRNRQVQIDWKADRIAVFVSKPQDGGIIHEMMIFPSFFEKYYAAKPMRDSLVVCSSCYSLANDSMANALLGAGAKTVLGFSNASSVEFAGNAVSDFFFDLALFNETTGGSYQPVSEITGQGETNLFVMRGATNLALGTYEVKLTPTEQMVNSIDNSRQLEVTVTPEVPGAVFEFEWSVSGEVEGQLASDDHASFATSFTSSNRHVTYRTQVTASTYDNKQDTVKVKVFRRFADGQRAKAGDASATLTFQASDPNKYYGAAYSHSSFRIQSGGYESTQEGGWVVPVPRFGSFQRIEVNILNWRDPFNGRTTASFVVLPSTAVQSVPRLSNSLLPYAGGTSYSDRAWLIPDNPGFQEGDSVYVFPYAGVFGSGPVFPDTQPPPPGAYLDRVSPCTVEATVIR